MEQPWTLYIFLILSGYAYMAETTVTCDIEDEINSCRYTVSCGLHAGSAPNLNCDYEPFVTFRIKYSEMEILSAGFFGATNFDSRVRVFEAINNTWLTISPATFRYYSKTINMNLSNNRIHDIQSEAFRNLMYLKYLNLSSNFLRELSSLSLAVSSDRHDTQVEVIDLSNNLLEKIAPDSFKEYRNLRRLYLQNNHIENLEDYVFINLINLTHLYLQNNKLTMINMTIINLKSLTELDLSHNKIQKISGYEINRLNSLEKVNMSFNNIEYVESNCFIQATSLEMLDLSNNYIKSPIETIMFVNNAKLNYLNLFNNSITNIAENAFQHNNLSYINLEENKLSGTITETMFTGLQRVKSLNLFKQNITSIKSNGFKEMTSLVYLNISTNGIESIDQSSFKNTSLLSILDISNNRLSNLNFLKECLLNLTELYLNNNSLVSIPENTFINQTLVKKLDISMNNIYTIEQYSLPLLNLQYFNVSGNPLSGIIKSNVTSPAKYLRYLDLSGLNISGIEDMAFTDLPVLARLNLSNNAINQIGPNNFINMGNMFSLDLSCNKLLSLQLNGTVTNLTALYLNNNRLSSTAGALPNSSRILYLDISFNNITEIFNESYLALKNLRVLHASHNRIINFNNPQTNLFSELRTLSLSSNQISFIDVSKFKNLVSLDISNNTLNVLNSTLFQNMDNLQVLDISNNNIKILPPGVFQNVKALKSLNMSSNHLTNLRYGSFRGLHNTEVIDISRNNITEMDVDIFHECTKLTRLIIDYNNIKQLDIEQLIRIVPTLITVSIGGNPLSCKQIVRDIKTINKSFLRIVEITSIHKIYHDDNVNGIKCGDINFTTSFIPASTSVPLTEHSSHTALLIWCSVLTIIFAAMAIGVLIYKRRLYLVGSYQQSRIELARSVDLSGSDFQNDLLN